MKSPRRTHGTYSNRSVPDYFWVGKISHLLFVPLLYKYLTLSNIVTTLPSFILRHYLSYLHGLNPSTPTSVYGRDSPKTTTTLTSSFLDLSRPETHLPRRELEKDLVLSCTTYVIPFEVHPLTIPTHTPPSNPRHTSPLRPLMDDTSPSRVP